MKFQMPETLDGLSLDEVAKLHREALAEANELNAIPDDKIKPEESAALIELVGHVGTLSDRRGELQTEATEAAEALATARKTLSEAGDPDEDGDDEGDGEEGADENGDEDEESEKAEKRELVAANAKSKSFAAKVAKQGAGKTSDEKADDLIDRSSALSIVAAANIPGFDSGSKIEGFDGLAEAFSRRAKTFASGSRAGRRGMKSLRDSSYGGTRLSDAAQRYSVARLEKPTNEFTITEKMSAEDQYDLIMKAASEKRLGGSSLVAAGGWCAPSEQIYGFLELESADGLLSMPEIAARRGGIQFTKGPQLGELLLEADLGWTMTEAQAEAGTFTKPIFDIECPDWDEVRMDAVGYALRAGLLTDAAYPELLRRYLALALIVHARRMNAATISRLSALIGTATTFAPVGAQPSATADLLSAIELNATRIREQYSMPLNATVEGVFPLWTRAIVRSDLSRRLGVDNMLSVTDAQIDAWFSQRQISAQFVRDYQAINAGAANTAGGTANWTTWPTQVEFMLYPAGSFVRLATDVIDIDTVYDTDNLTQNQFLAAFFEEGFALANTGGSGVKVQVGLPNLFGSVGYPSIGALANVAPAAA